MGMWKDSYLRMGTSRDLEVRNGDVEGFKGKKGEYEGI